MPNGSYLLDTNIVIAMFKGDESTKKHLEQAEQVFLSVISLGELYYGALHSIQVEKNMVKLRELSSILTVLPCDLVTAYQYGQIKNSLRKKGRPIPENDIWIAACAIQNGLVLVSRDDHFTNVENLQVDCWQQAFKV